MAQPTDQQVEDLARTWFARDFEHDLPDEWNRLEPYVRENYRTDARWMWRYVEERDERILSDQSRWVPDGSHDGGHMERLTWREVVEEQKNKLQRLETLQTLLSDLDRNEHGRHEGDVDSSDATGWSQGNPRLKQGDVLGYTIAGMRRPYVMPERGKRHDVNAWIAPTADVQGTPL